MSRTTARWLFFLWSFVATVALGCNLPDPSDFIAEPEPEPDVLPLPPPVGTPPVVGFQVVAVVPDLGVSRGFDLVEIQGGGFRDDSRVFFGGSESPNVTVASAALIYALTPPHPVGIVPVRVVNIDGTQAELSPGFGYSDGVEVAAVTPDFGSGGGGVPVEVSGRGLKHTTAILFGGRAAIAVTILDDEKALVTVPEHSAGLVDVHVVTPFGTAELARGFRYLSLPRVEALSPMVAPEAGGGTLTLVGAGLVPESVVSIGGSLAEVLATSTDNRRLIVRIPAGKAGPADVAVTSAGGAVRLVGAFHWLNEAAGPEVLGVLPHEGQASGGGEVAVAVAGPLDDEVSVWFGDAPAEVLSVDPEAHVVLVSAPPGTADSVVAVTVGHGGATARIPGESAYTYIPTLGVKSATPTSVPRAGGVLLTVTGVGFSVVDIDAVVIGGLPATDIRVVDDHTLTVITPVGSPGLSDIVVRAGSREARLPGGVTVVGDGPRIWVVDPPRGAIAGNTWVRLYGQDLPADIRVSFGSIPAPFIEWRSPTEVAVRTPRSEAVDLVDLQVSAGGFPQIYLTNAFSYFDPRSGYGGTWGDPIDASLNVTVLANGSGDPVEQALVVVGHENPPRLLGYTDDRGQITLSDADLTGRLDVTAAKFAHSAGSVMDFDAENVTILLTPPSTPATGTPPPPLQPGSVAGTVEGVGKYLTLPPWPCDEIVNRQLGFCSYCNTDADCAETASLCTRVSGARPFCSAACQTDTDCLGASTNAGLEVDFVCRPSGAGQESRCLPNPGTARAECFASATSYLMTPMAGFGEGVIDLSTEDREFRLEGVRLGEIAVYCLAGGYRAEMAAPFKPVVMGIARHQIVLPGANDGQPATPPTSVSIRLDIPLDRSTNVLFGTQPLTPTGPTTTELRAHIDLGSDGYIPISRKVVGPAATSTRLEGLPRLETDDLAGSEYVFHGVSNSPEGGTGLPEADVLRLKVRTLERGAALRDEGAGWQPWLTGYDGDVLGLAVAGPDNVFAATASGAVLHFDGLQWSAQPITQGPALRAACSDLAGGAVFVGDEGRVVRWRSQGWETTTSGAPAILRGVAALGPDAFVAVGDYVIRESDDETWHDVSVGPPKALNAVAVAGSQAFAVGRFGAVMERAAGGGWSPATVPHYSDLHAIYATADGFFVAVGDGGAALIRTPDGAFRVDATGVDGALYGVHGRSAADVIAVGDTGTVVHFDGQQWTTLSVGRADVSLKAVIANGPTWMALGIPGVAAGPFLNIPVFTQPTLGGPWTDRRFGWKQAGRSPAFYGMRIYGGNGAIWSIMSPGWLRSMELPDLNALSGQAIVPSGPKSMLITAADHRSFSIDAFDNGVFSPENWNAWIYQLHDFDSGALPDEALGGGP